MLDQGIPDEKIVAYATGNEARLRAQSLGYW
jgi:hypothetical protein